MKLRSRMLRKHAEEHCRMKVLVDLIGRSKGCPVLYTDALRSGFRNKHVLIEGCQKHKGRERCSKKRRTSSKTRSNDPTSPQLNPGYQDMVLLFGVKCIPLASRIETLQKNRKPRTRH